MRDKTLKKAGFFMRETKAPPLEWEGCEGAVCTASSDKGEYTCWFLSVAQNRGYRVIRELE